MLLLTKEDHIWLIYFCHRWKITELALFGSALRVDFRTDSDLDFLATFSQQAEWGLLDHTAMQEELSNYFNRTIDLVSRKGVEQSANSRRRRRILETAEVVYAA